MELNLGPINLCLEMFDVGGGGAGASWDEKDCCLVGFIEFMMGYGWLWWPAMYARMIFMAIHTQIFVETRLSTTRAFEK